jgi:hypothetical protein
LAHPFLLCQSYLLILIRIFAMIFLSYCFSLSLNVWILNGIYFSVDFDFGFWNGTSSVETSVFVVSDQSSRTQI